MKNTPQTLSLLCILVLLINGFLSSCNSIEDISSKDIIDNASKQKNEDITIIEGKIEEDNLDTTHLSIKFNDETYKVIAIHVSESEYLIPYIDFNRITDMHLKYTSNDNKIRSRSYGMDLSIDLVNKKYYKNNVEIKIIEKLQIIDNSIYLPLNELLSVLGYSIEYADDNKAAVSSDNIMNRPLLHYVIDDSDKGYDWFLTIPPLVKSDKQVISLHLNQSNLMNDHYNASLEYRESVLSNENGRDDNFIHLTVIMVEDEWHGNALQMDHMFDSPNPFYQRSDKKIAVIIENAIAYIENQGINVYDKVVVEGFSGEGVFAHKFAVLWPEKVLAVVGGQCGGYLTMLDPPYNDIELDWPYGLKGYEDNMDRPFNKEAFDKII